MQPCLLQEKIYMPIPKSNIFFLYLVSQDYNLDYDSYDSMVVAANSEDQAKLMHPFYGYCPDGLPQDDQDWVTDTSKVEVELIGLSTLYTEPTVILTSSYT